MDANIGQNDLYWIAGLIEGEGCFYFRRRKIVGKLTKYRYKYTALITVGMTDKDIIQKLAFFWGTTVRMQRSQIANNKPYYVTVIHGKQAISWMMTLYSLMGKRRKAKIKDIINEWKVENNGC